jgi:glutamate--cysteine ligase
MPADRRTLTPADVHDFVRRHCFGTDDARPPGTGRVGIELELLTRPTADPGHRPEAGDLLDAVAAASLPRQAAITLEPGGQVEISSRPHLGAGAAIEATAADLDALRSGLASAGIETTAVGLDPDRPHRRVVTGPRYDAMEAYFDSGGAAGRAMMCGTASVQVNVDLGDVATLTRRWRLTHAIGPVLVAAFANSPLAGGRPTGARSSRQQIWAALDATRSSPVAGARAPQSLTPADTWARYALAADVMLIRIQSDRFQPLTGGLPFAAWMGAGHELGYPTLDDFAYHLTTLFPPVRPKGWLELRMLDAVPDPWWRVAVAVVIALLDDPVAFDVAERACAPVADCWADAAAHGLAHPGLASAARTCFAAALGAMPGLGVDPATVAATEAFVERYVDRARCPGDDLLEAWAKESPPAFVSAVSPGRR